MNVMEINIKTVLRNTESEFRIHHNRIHLLDFADYRTPMRIQTKQNKHKPDES